MGIRFEISSRFQIVNGHEKSTHFKMGIRFEISSRFQMGIRFEISSRFQIVNGPEISSLILTRPRPSLRSNSNQAPFPPFFLPLGLDATFSVFLAPHLPPN